MMTDYNRSDVLTNTTTSTTYQTETGQTIVGK